MNWVMRRFGFLLAGILSGDCRVFSVFAFLVPFVVRALPELLMGGYLTGFDTISYYVPITLKWVNYGVGFWEFFGVAPLLYVLLSGLTLAGVPLVVSLKVLPPLLHGFLGLAVFTYASEGLKWSLRKSLLVSLIATLYFVGLRISWDMLRSELGLIFLFVFLVMLQRYASSFSWRRFSALLFFGVLVVLAHQLVSVVMFVIVFAMVLERRLKRDYSFVRRVFAACLPAIALFLLTAYADIVVLPGSTDWLVASGQSAWLNLMGFSSLSDGLVNAVGFLLFCYFPLFPFAFLGIRGFSGLSLKVWVVWCLIGVLLPFFFVFAPLSYRWILLLVFPLAFFAVEGFERLRFRLLKGVLAGFMVFLSFSFVFLPAEAAFPYFSLYHSYVPSSMLQNSVALDDCKDVVAVLSWAENNFDDGDVLLVHDAFYGWALLYAGCVRIVCYGYASPEDAVLAFLQAGKSRIYLIWWVSGNGWQSLASYPKMFKEVYSSGRMALYEFEAEI
ncbi:MAG: hypothetical protein QW674_03230 [Candidatus Bathyarchaeia archaeon]